MCGTDALTQRPIAGKIWVQSGIKGVASCTGSTLTVAGMPVTTDTSSILLGTTGAVTDLTALNNQAVELARLANGTWVEAKGMLSNGVLTATKIEFEGSQSNGCAADWNDNDSDGLHHRSLSTLSTPTELQTSRSFEMYGTLSCSAANVGCTLTSGAVTYTADMLTARWDDHQSRVSGYVEAKGYLTGNTFKVRKIESKDRRDGRGYGDDD